MASASYTLVEISKHNGKDRSKTWIIVSGSVYDVTAYLGEHPGGANMINEWAGKDATKAFANIGHSSFAKNNLKKFKIGELAEGEKNGDLGGVAAAGSCSRNSIPEDEKTGKRSFLSIITCGLAT